MYLGVLAGLTTCVLWGLTFVAPRAVAPFSAYDLAAARYGLFGLTCVVLMLNHRFRPAGMTPRLWISGILLGSIGYVGYFLLASFAVKQAGAVIPPLITGLMPVLLPILANLRENALPWKDLAIPLSLIVLGLAIANAASFGHGNTIAPPGSTSVLVGALWATAALVVWIGYGIGNAHIMRRPDAPDTLHWTGIQGIGSGLAAAMLIPLLSYHTFATATGAELSRFAVWAILMALAGSWLATWCWVVSAKRLPLSLSSQLVIAETVFGLIFGLMFERRWPTMPEASGALLQVSGVCMAVYVFGRSRKVAIAAA